MNIFAYLDNKKTEFNLSKITFEVSDERFQSLFASKGRYPTNKDIDFEDEIVEIKSDFYIHDAKTLKAIKEFSTHLRTEVIDDIECITHNWFHFKTGRSLSEVHSFIKSLG